MRVGLNGGLSVPAFNYTSVALNADWKISARSAARSLEHKCDQVRKLARGCMQLLAPRLYYNLKVRSGLDVRQPPGPDTKQFVEEFICALEGADDHFEVDVECTTMDLEGR